MKIYLLIAAFCALPFNVIAAERKPVADIDTNAMTSEMQAITQEENSKHVSLAWWMPTEFWQASFAKSSETPASLNKDVAEAFSGVSVIAIAEADISSLASFDFYSREDVEKNLVVTYVDSQGTQHVLQAENKINRKLEVLLGIMKPILASAVGNLGSNLNFYVFHDMAPSDKHARLIDPYSSGYIDVQFTTKLGMVNHSRIQLPLDSLFVPRMCPGGRKAHITWKYCPWDGTPLND